MVVLLVVAGGGGGSAAGGAGGDGAECATVTASWPTCRSSYTHGHTSMTGY